MPKPEIRAQVRDDLDRELTSKGQRQARRMAGVAGRTPACVGAHPRQPGGAYGRPSRRWVA